jgi:predicted AlkP superfamily phosphohydrolase/phosphomutase
MRRVVPVQLRSSIKNRLPIPLQDRLTLFWRLHDVDWSRARAFAAFGDLDAYIRVNLKGREAAGIVERGPEYSALCRHIAAGFLSFVDEDTREPVVDNVEYVDETFPDGARRDHLPDLIVHWAPSSAAQHRRIMSPQFGAVDWPTPGFHPQGRSGDHAREGFLIASGVPIRASSRRASILDLAPTVYDLLEIEIPPDFSGQSLMRRSD